MAAEAQRTIKAVRMNNGNIGWPPCLINLHAGARFVFHVVLAKALRHTHMCGATRSDLMLRACDSFDFGALQHESNQALATPEIAKSRKKSHTLRSCPRAARTASRSMAAGSVPAPRVAAARPSPWPSFETRLRRSSG